VTAVRTLLVDDHPVVLAGLRQLLAGTRFTVVAEATTAEQCLAAALSERPELILLDLRMEHATGPDITRRLKLAGSKARVAILTGYEDEVLLNACLEEGVDALLLKDTSRSELVSVLGQVMVAQSPVIDSRLVARLTSLASNGAAHQVGLTRREHAVLRLLAMGLTSAEIAADLGLSVNTVRSYVQATLMKLDAHSRIEAVSTARRLRLV
jgi:two-component system nitrate/nitrite response regulator NarL